MKLIIYFFSFFLSIGLQSQNPPGTVQLSNNLYIDVAPVDNILFLEYLRHQEKLPTKTLDSILKNSNSFGLNAESFFGKKEIETTDRLVLIESTIKEDYYLEHPKFSKYPIININKVDAENYCKWRTKAVMLNYAIESKTEEERSKFPKSITYKLPTTEELTTAIKKFGFSKGVNSDTEGIPFLVYRNKYKKKNKKAIFIKNNLSEFVSDRIAHGSNWGNYEHQENTNDFTTFRCICEISE